MCGVRKNQIMTINIPAYSTVLKQNSKINFHLVEEPEQAGSVMNFLQSPRISKTNHGGRFIIVRMNQPLFYSSALTRNAVHPERFKSM